MALLAIAVGAGLRWTLAEVFGEGIPPFITFFPTVALVSALGGAGPGLVATALSCVTIVALFFEPPHLPGEWIGLLVFAVTGVVLAVIGGRLREAHAAVAQRVAAREETLRILDAAPVFALDPDFRITRWRAGAERLYGYAADQAVGQLASELLQTRFPEPLDHIHAQLDATGHWSGRLRQAGADGRALVVATEWVLVRDATGAPTAIVESCTDITEHVRAEEERRWTEGRLATAVQAADLGSWDWDAQTGALTWSDRCKSMFDLPPEATVTYDSFLAAVHPDDRARVDAVVRQALQADGSYQVEMRVPMRDGSVRWLVSTGRAVFREEGGQRKATRFSGVAQDITVRKLAEEALRESEQILRTRTAAIHTAADMVVITDAAGTIQYVNPAFTAATGYEIAEIVGQNPRILKSDQHSREFYADLWGTVLGGRVWRGEVVNRRKDGTTYIEEMTITPVAGADGAVTNFIAIKRDITDRKRIEDVLRQSEHRLRALAEASSDVLYSMSPDWSEMLELRSTGFLAETSAPDRNWLSKYIHPDDTGRVTAAIEEAIRDRRAFEFEHRVLKADGTTGWTYSRAVPVVGDDGGIREWFGAASDVTARKRAEEALVELNDALERRVDERTRQLRELNADLMRAEQRERSRLAQVLHDGLQQFLVAAKMQVTLLGRHTTHEAVKTAEQLLDQSIEASRSLAVDLSPPVLRQAGLAGALEWLSRWMKDKHGMTVCVDVGGQRFQAEPELRTFLFEAAREMLFNVVKHAGTDEAVVSLERLGDSLSICVADRGKGFELPSTPEAPLHGTGLLAIRHRAELMGGRVEVESAPGNGTRVRLVVPFAIEEPETPSEPAVVLRFPERRTRDRRGAVIRVVLADDHAVLRQGVAAALAAEHGIEVVGEAATGAEAVERVAAVVPDVVLMDISMPEMDGVEATRRIHAAHPFVRVIGLSMHDERSVIDRMVEAGAAAFVTKGAPMEELVRAVRGNGGVSAVATGGR